MGSVGLGLKVEALIQYLGLGFHWVKFRVWQLGRLGLIGLGLD